MSDVLFRPYNAEPEQERSEALVFTPAAQPQYGPARWPEGPAEYRRGTRPPVNIEDLPPPDQAIFTPAVQPGGTNREQRNAFARLAEFLGLRRSPENQNTIEMQGPGIGTAAEALFTAGEDLFMQVANAGPARISEDYSLGDKLRDTGSIARELFNVTRFGDQTPYETPYPEATPGQRLFSGAIDPTDAARVLTLLAPRNLKYFTERWRNIEYVPASILAEYSGNNLRRSPEQMEILKRDILANPEGLDDPIRVMFNDETGTFLIGEGNHRVALAAEMGIPVPVVVVRSNWETPTSRPGLVPQDAMDRIRAFADQHHGYVPSNLSASEIGLPTVSLDEIVDFIDRRAAAGDFPVEEAQQFREFVATYQPEFMIPGTTPRVIRGDETVSFDRPTSAPTFSSETPASIVDELQFWAEQAVDRYDETAPNLLRLIDEQGEKLSNYIADNYSFVVDTLANSPTQARQVFTTIAPDIIIDDQDTIELLRKLQNLSPSATRNPALESELNSLLQSNLSQSAVQPSVAGLPEDVLRNTLPFEEFKPVHLPFLKKFDDELQEGMDYLKRELQLDLDLMDENQIYDALSPVLGMTSSRIRDLSEAYQEVLAEVYELQRQADLEDAARWFENQLGNGDVDN